MVEAKKVKKPGRDWKSSKSGNYWTKMTKYGQQYYCQHCGMKKLGFPVDRDHRLGCPLREKQ
jgi:hypothetical protein